MTTLVKILSTTVAVGIGAITAHVITKKKYNAKVNDAMEEISKLNNEIDNLKNKSENNEVDIYLNKIKEMKNEKNESEKYLNVYKSTMKKIHEEVKEVIPEIIKESDNLDDTISYIDEYLNSIDDIIESADEESLECAVMEYDTKLSEIKEVQEETTNNEEESDDTEDDDYCLDIINRFNLSDVMTDEEYTNIHSQLENLDDDEIVEMYSSIIDNILETIFLKRQISSSVGSPTELSDLNLITEFSIDRETLDKMDDFYENLKASLVNIINMKNFFTHYNMHRTNDYLNKMEYWKITPNTSDIIQRHIEWVDESINDNDERIKNIMCLSNILRNIKSIIDNEDDGLSHFNILHKELYELYSDHGMSDKAKFESYINNEYDDIEEEMEKLYSSLTN